MLPMPAPNYDEIMTLINKLEYACSPSQFELFRLDRLIAKIEKVDRAAGLSFRASYYGIQNNFIEAEKWHLAAMAEFPEISYVYFNYAGTLTREGKHNLAIDMLLKAISGGADLDCILGLLQNAAWAKRMDILEEWLPKYCKLTGETLSIEQYVEMLGVPDTYLHSNECYAAACASGSLNAWDNPEEDAAWRHLQ